MLLILDCCSSITRKVPIFLQINNQPAAIYFILFIVRFRTLSVQFYTFLSDILPVLMNVKAAIAINCAGLINAWYT